MWSVSQGASKVLPQIPHLSPYLTAAIRAMSGVTLLRIYDVFTGSVGCGAARMLRGGGAEATLAPPTLRSSSSSLPRDAARSSTSPRLSMETEESKARNAESCRPEPGARKEHPKAMAMRSASQQSHSIY